MSQVRHTPGSIFRWQSLLLIHLQEGWLIFLAGSVTWDTLHACAWRAGLHRYPMLGLVLRLLSAHGNCIKEYQMCVVDAVPNSRTSEGL